MSRQSSGYLVLALSVVWAACGDGSTRDAPGSASDTSAAHVGDAGAPASGRATDASVDRPTNARPPTTMTGRDAQVDATTHGQPATRLDAGTVVASDGGGPLATAPDATATPSGALWKPKPGTRWQWDLSGDVTTLDLAVDVYDIDGFEADAALVAKLHAMGKKVICYLSVGTYEPNRADAQDFPKEALGKYWAEWDETYIDIRSEAVRTIMKTRFDMCKAKGFDAIEPDNMDMFEGGMNETGFPLTTADGVAYAKWLAAEAHARNLSIGQKNAASITSDIEADYDWALTEDCFVDGWCDDMKSYPDHDKAMFMCEYTDTKVDFAAACSAASQRKFSAILKARALDSMVQFCQ